MNEKTKVLDNDGLGILIGLIKDEFVTKDEFNYKAIAINSFTNSRNTVEMGTVITELTLNWTLNKKAIEQRIDNEVVDPSVNTKKLTGQNITSNKTFTLTVKDEKEATATRQTSITFLNGVYWGVGSNEAEINSEFIKSLTKGLQSSKAKTFTVNAGEGQHIYYAIPTRYGDCNFNVGGFDGGFNKISTIQFENESKYTESYDVYKSTNANLGNTTVTVK